MTLVSEQQAVGLAHVARGSNGRLYARRFDHDEAIRRHAAGESLTAIAASFGVTHSAIWQAVTPGAKGRSVAQHRLWRTGACERCGGPAMRLVSSNKRNNPDGRCLCNTCRHRVSRKPIQLVDGVAQAHCGHCDTWKPLDEFAPRVARALDAGKVPVYRCGACDTAERQRHRDAHKVPCVGCGELCLPPNEKKTNGAAVPRCRSCFARSLRKPNAETSEAASTRKGTGS